MRKKPQLMQMKVWDPVVDPNMGTNVCSWTTDDEEWDAYPIFVFRHGQLHDPRWVLDGDSGEVFPANGEGLKERMERVPIDDDEWVEALNSCVANAPAKMFGRVQLMVKAEDWGDDSDNIVYIVAKRAPVPPVATKPRPVPTVALSPA